MKERPFVAYQHEVRAILDGSQTRFTRPIKPHPELGKPWKWWTVDPLEMDIPIALCPYGILGDRLWVRETWATVNTFDKLAPKDIPKGDQRWPAVWYDAHPQAAASISNSGSQFIGKRRPSTHMPRWASRITLEVTGVRVEQDSGQWLWVVEFRVSDKRRTTMTSKRSCGAS